MLKKTLAILTAVIMFAVVGATPLFAVDSVTTTSDYYDSTGYDWSTAYDTTTQELTDEEAAAAAAMLAGFGIVWVIIFGVISIPVYIYFSLAQMTISNKLGVKNSWFAWIPILNYYNLVKCAGLSGWTALLFLVPLVNVGLIVYAFMKISERRGFDQMLGLLMLVPLAQMVIPGYLAWAEPKKA